MRNFRIVFGYELKNQLSKKSMILTTLILTLVMAGVTFIPRISGLLSSGAKEGAPKAAYSALADQTGYTSEDAALMERVAKALDLKEENLYQDRDCLVKAVQGKKLKTGFVLTGPTAFEAVWQDKELEASTAEQLAEALRSMFVNDKLSEKNITLEELQALQNTQVDYQETILGKNSANSVFLAFALLFVVYLIVLIYGSITSTMIAREKDSKTMELLITSCKPSSLILGKVAASGVSAVLQMGIIFLGAFIGYKINQSTMPPYLTAMLSGTLTMQYVITYLLYSIVGYVMYLFLYAALGSTVSKVEDVNNATGLVQILFVAGYISSSFAMNMPNSPLSVVTSIFPFTSLMVMPLRSAIVTVPVWQYLLSGSLLILSAVLLAALSIKIYRWGTLNYGNKKGLLHAVRMVTKAR